MSFRVGMKVVCVEDPLSLWEKIEQWLYPQPGDDPILGEIYTVSNVYRAPCGTLGLELFELYSPADEHWGPGFAATGFRPVVTRKTDISVFTEIARDLTKRKPVKITERT